MIDPAVLVEEIRTFRGQGFLGSDDDLVVAERAHLTLPHHREIDRLREEGAGQASAPPSKGIGPTYESKAARIGLRVGDLLRPERFRARLDAPRSRRWRRRSRALGGAAPDAAEIAAALPGARPRSCGRSSATPRAPCTTPIVRGDNVLFEGAQGVLLDVDHGTYPFVTSSSTTAGGACAGARHRPDRDRHRPGHRQGVRDARRRRTVPDRAHDDDRRSAAQARQRVRLDHRPAAPLRLARPAGAAAGRPPVGHRGPALTKLDVLAGLERVEALRRLPARRPDAGRDAARPRRPRRGRADLRGAATGWPRGRRTPPSATPAAAAVRRAGQRAGRDPGLGHLLGRRARRRRSSRGIPSS